MNPTLSPDQQQNNYTVLTLCPVQLMIQLALMGFAEYVLHLTRMNPDQMYLHQDCGYLSIAYFKFHVDDVSGEAVALAALLLLLLLVSE